MLDTNVATLLNFYEQLHDIEHEHCDVAWFSRDGKLVKIPTLGLFVTSRLKRVYGMCNRMCTKGFLNYFSAIIEFLKVVLRVKL